MRHSTRIDGQGRRRAGVLAALLGIGASACATVPHPTSAAMAITMSRATASLPYAFAAGDEVDIHVFKDPDLDADVVVRPDGRVALMALGEVTVAGRSPDDVAAEIAQRYNKPAGEVTVNLKSSSTQRVFVGGEVNHAGAVPLGGHMTVLGAILSAEGFKDDAKMSEVVVIRRDATDGRRAMVIALNLDDAISGKDTDQDLPLQSNDIVVVPRTGVGDFDVWIDQYIRRALPFTLSGNFTVYYGKVIP
jgi:polysaccharide biosynthesis/export protein